VFCNACVSFEHQEKFVELIYANLMTCSPTLESDNEHLRMHLEKAKDYLSAAEHQFSFGAAAKTLNSILAECDAPNHIDLLSLDVEGAEIEVLKGIDHLRYRFKYLCIEVRDYKKINDYLSQKNYFFLKQLSDRDYLFVGSDMS